MKVLAVGGEGTIDAGERVVLTRSTRRHSANPWLRVGASAAAACLAGVVFFAWLVHSQPELGGDEPCYITEARSLAIGHDLDLTDDFRDPAGVGRYAPGVEKWYRNCAADYRHVGKLRSSYSPGLGVLLAPVVGVAFDNINYLRSAMVLLAMVFAYELHALLIDIAGRPKLSVWAVWAMVVLPLPIAAFANAFYPELPAALLCTIAGRCLLRVGRSDLWRLGTAAAVAPLPWLHYRFGVIAVVLLALAVFAGEPPSRRAFGRRLAFTVPPMLVSLVGLAVLYQRLYGSPSPSAPYRGGTAALVHWTLAGAYHTGLGTLFHPLVGLLPFNPTLLVALVGFPLVVRRFRWVGAVLVGLFVAQLVLINPLGFFGQTLPGRFAIVLLPLLAVAGLLALEELPLLGVAAAVLALPTALVTIEGWRHYASLYGRATANLGLIKATRNLWPPQQLQSATDWTRALVWFGAIAVVAAATLRHSRIQGGYGAPGSDARPSPTGTSS